jgi:hypothetical protein
MPYIDLVFCSSSHVVESDRIENEIENNSSDSNEFENDIEKKIQTKFDKWN